MSGAYSFGVIGQKVKGLESLIAEKVERQDELERDFREVTDRLTRLETQMTNAVSLLTEVRNAVLYKGSGGH